MENLLKEVKKSLPQINVQEARMQEMEKEKLNKMYGNESLKIVNYKKEDFDILLKENVDETLEIPFMYSESNSPTTIIKLIKFIYQTASKKYDKSKLCRAYIVEAVLVKIIEKLTGLKAEYQKSAIRDLGYLSFFDKIDLDVEF